MNCGILTFHFAHNYGAMLQAYALKHFVENLGHKVTVVDYASTHMRRGYHPRFRSYLKPTNWGWMWRRREQYERFETFYRDQLGCCKTTTNYEQAVDAVSPDVLIVGSDQVWNDHLSLCDESYFLPLKQGRTIAYAASFGRSHLTDWQEKEVKQHLTAFDHLSVRETDGAAEVKRLLGQDIPVVLDPVFLLSKDEWLSMTRAPASEQGDYILYYALRDDPQLIEKTKRLAQQEHLPVLAVHPQCIRQKVGTTLRDVGPLEFLSLIRHAKYVCANSFHAAAFSVLFGTKLVPVPISTKETRVVSLLEKIGAEEVYRKETADKESCYELDRLNPSKLNEAILFSKNYLQQALS